MKFKSNLKIFIQGNAFENVVCKMAAILSWPQCVNFLLDQKMSCYLFVFNLFNPCAKITFHIILCHWLFKFTPEKDKKHPPYIITILVADDLVTQEAESSAAMPLTYFAQNISLSARRHYGDVIMGTIASQITSLMIVYSTVYSDAIHRWIPRTNGQ